MLIAILLALLDFVASALERQYAKRPAQTAGAGHHPAGMSELLSPDLALLQFIDYTTPDRRRRSRSQRRCTRRRRPRRSWTRS